MLRPARHMNMYAYRQTQEPPESFSYSIYFICVFLYR